MGRITVTVLILSCLLLASAVIGLNTHPSLHPWEAFAPQPEDLTVQPQGLRVTWLGTATVLISDGQHHLLSDGFFSRPGLVALASGPIAPQQDRINATLARHGITGLDAVMVLHSHYDHAMDSPLVAQATGATVMGSASTANVARGAGIPEERILTVTPGKPETVGSFRVTFLVSDHVPQNRLIDSATGMNETIDTPLTPPAWVNQWKEGESWAVLIEHNNGKILLQGSAGFQKGQLQGRQADLALVSSVGLFRQNSDYQRDYYQNTVADSGAHTVIPIHWDDFFAPLQDQDTPPLPWLIEHTSASFDVLADQAQDNGVRFVVMRPGQTFWLPPQAESDSGGNPAAR